MVDIIRAIAEFVGTFVFLFVILQSGIIAGTTTAIQPFIIVSGLLVAIFMFGTVTGGHFNPAVSAMLYARGGNAHVGTIVGLLTYVVAQVAGGFVAQLAHKQMYN
jgi:glycerol uptake facilitator-like aquaporin